MAKNGHAHHLPENQMKRFVHMAGIALCVFAGVAAGQEIRLSDPVPITLADGQQINILGKGHAAPAYADVDGDMVPDLLVGEFEGGLCRVYHNYGTATKPEFRDFKYLRAGGDVAIVPPS